ncbi:hypothetical protein Tco_0902945 [Tanacetum coccineum]
MRINPGMKPKEPSYQVALDALALTTCYPHSLSYLKFQSSICISFGLPSPNIKHHIDSRSITKVISSEESPSKKKSAKSKKGSAPKPKPTKKKAPIKAGRVKGLNVLSEVALSKAAQLKEVAKQSKKDFHISHASGSGDGTDFESGVPDEQHRKTSGTDDGAGTKPRVLDVPKYDFESKKESWGDSRKEDDDDDENDSEDESNNGDNDDDGNDGNDGDGGDDDDANDDDNQEDDGTNDDDEETDNDRTESDRIKILVLNQSSTEYYEEEEEEKIDDEEKMDEEEDDEVTKELYNDVNVNLGNRDADMTNADQVLDTQKKTDEQVQSSSVSSDFTSKLLNLENLSLADNEIASLMDTTVRHEEPSGQTSTLFTVPITTIPPPPPFFNPLQQQATPTPTPTTSEATTSFPLLLDFSSVFKFNDRVTNLEKDIYPKGILAHNLDCRAEAQAEKMDYIELVDTSIRAILKEEVNTQLPQILPQAVSDFATHVIEKNVTESLEAAVLARSSSQPKSTYEATASLSEFELTKIRIDKMEKNKSYDKADYKRELYDALRSREDRDKDQDPFNGSDRVMKRRKSSKEVESSKDSRSKEKKSSSTSKYASHSQHKPSSKSVYAEEPNHRVRQVIPQDFFINNDLEYLKGGDLSRRRVEDLQLGVESYQKKLNLTKPDSYRSELRNRTAYTSYSDHHGMIYVDQFDRKRLMRTDELHKFSDGTLNDVRTALHDISSSIKMEYLLKRKWIRLDKKRARVMVQDIDKQLYAEFREVRWWKRIRE